MLNKFFENNYHLHFIVSAIIGYFISEATTYVSLIFPVFRNYFWVFFVTVLIVFLANLSKEYIQYAFHISAEFDWYDIFWGVIGGIIGTILIKIL